MKKLYFITASIWINAIAIAQPKTGNDVTVPLHAMKPDYPFLYAVPQITEVKMVLDRLYHYLDSVTPAQLVHRNTGANVSLNGIDTHTIIKPGDYRLGSYEWGVTYSAMLQAADATGDKKYSQYTHDRVMFIVNSVPAFRSLYQKYPLRSNPFRQPLEPRALDYAGAICAAMIKVQRQKPDKNLKAQIDHYIDFIVNKEHRLADGTLARMRPLKNTLWLDDLYMAVPALAQMGKLSGDKKYYDEAVKQILLFSERMFNKQLGIYMHGWVEDMIDHPEFHWARANGWALMAMTELLEVLPESHPGYKPVEQQLQAHIKGLAAFQSGQGLWHQLLDRTDSYLETSASAIYTYCIARAVNKGRIDAKAYSPLSLLAWNAITTKVNRIGQVEGTCVGTGMAFDPAFYYYRPINVFAAHSYGPVLLAGAEITNLLNNYIFEINDSALQLKSKK